MKKATDILAIERTNLANQRTLMAYIRTSFYFLGLGLTIVGIESFERLKFIAIPLFLLSPIMIGIGAISFIRERRKIARISLKMSAAE